MRLGGIRNDAKITASPSIFYILLAGVLTGMMQKIAHKSLNLLDILLARVLT